MADETVLNDQFNYETMLNPDIQNSNSSEQTVINLAVSGGTTLVKNQRIDGYTIIEQMQVSTGEADLYLCECDGNRYVIKLYRREVAVKQDILSALLSIDSPYVSKLVSAGKYNNRSYEIIPYYENGSLAQQIQSGKRYTLVELKTIIVPQLNEALRELHTHNIIHKDLKPSNIMLSDNGRDVVIIDFGISSIRENGNTVVMTKTGFTLDYTAQEAIRGLFLNESDYYSLGITLFELYTGRTPYNGLTAEEKEQYSAIQRIPLPENMDEELKELITALTYNDISNRKEKENPNRRWTYEEVKNWCAGIKQLIPGKIIQNKVSNSDSLGGAKFLFKGVEYSDRRKLTVAFAKHWEDGKKLLFNGILASKFMSVDSDFAEACMEAENAYGMAVDPDILFFRILYKLDPSLTDFVWRGEHFINLQSFGKYVQDKLWKQNHPDMSFVNDVLYKRVLSEYLNTLEGVADVTWNAVTNLEMSFIQHYKDTRTRYMNYHLLGYLLSERKVFYINGREFATVDELVAYMQEMLHLSYQNFESFCNELVNDNGTLNIGLEAWLMVLGKTDQIAEFKDKLRV